MFSHVILKTVRGSSYFNSHGKMRKLHFKQFVYLSSPPPPQKKQSWSRPRIPPQFPDSKHSAVSNIQLCFPCETTAGSSGTGWLDRGSHRVGWGRTSLFGKIRKPMDHSRAYHRGLWWWLHQSHSAQNCVWLVTEAERVSCCPCGGWCFYWGGNGGYFCCCCCYYYYYYYWLLDKQGNLSTHNCFSFLPRIRHKGLNIQRWGEQEKKP